MANAYVACNLIFTLSEAEYAFQKRKRIIPLVLEGGYRADGWLGIILGTKLFYDFSGKYSFQSRLDALIKELGTLGIQDQMGSMGLDVSGSHHIVEKPYEQGEKVCHFMSSCFSHESMLNGEIIYVATIIPHLRSDSTYAPKMFQWFVIQDHNIIKIHLTNCCY